MPKVDVLVRPAVVADAPALTRLSAELGYEGTDGQTRWRLAQFARLEDHAVLVAEIAGRGVVGWVHVFASYRVESDPRAEIGGLVVSGSERGAGVGRALVDAAEQWARGRGFDSIRVRTNVSREIAPKFYQRLGFEQAKTQDVFEKRITRPEVVGV